MNMRSNLHVQTNIAVQLRSGWHLKMCPNIQQAPTCYHNSIAISILIQHSQMKSSKLKLILQILANPAIGRQIFTRLLNIPALSILFQLSLITIQLWCMIGEWLAIPGLLQVFWPLIIDTSVFHSGSPITTLVSLLTSVTLQLNMEPIYLLVPNSSTIAQHWTSILLC